MAVGDIVSGISGANTTLTFQPAAGVEVCITAVQSIASQPPRLTNGTINTVHGICTDNQYSMKMMINNTNYLQIDNLGGSSRSGYTGIQIK